MKNSHFCMGILVAICLAKLNPTIGSAGGILRPEITVKYFAVSTIFLISGITLPTAALTVAILRWDLHLFVQGFTFVAFPVIVYILVSILQHTFLHPALLEGMTLLSTMPPPVSSAVILTKSVGGNEAAAVFNSAFGSMLGIVVTPFLIVLIFGSSELDLPYYKIFKELFIMVILPLIVGQIIHNTWYKFKRRQNIPFKTIGQLLIHFIVYTTFCNTFSRTDFQLDALSLVFTIFLIILFQLCVMMFLSHTSSSSMFSFTPADSVAITFCGTHKSLTLGIPMIEIIFANNPNMSLLSIPLLMYNPIQILLGGMSILIFRQWLLDQKRRRWKPEFNWSHV
ncbi:sodium/bile acid cotransporter 7 [Plakobranchus ocellatus]|uniref:Sodium/bile acid cotransporter 7 n=1 Tax=Plakobranchus ocellatus TaxID=259542 RepID=A0AAV4ASS4_9GAST|nr:sodium/bile acid cotransporter 7 [Plakobranchus ocellatus]